MDLIDSSGIRKVFELAGQLEDPVNLSIGQPDFDVPDPVKAEAMKQIDEGFNDYTQTQGIPELIAGVHAHYSRRYGVEFEDGMICSGVSGALNLALMALIEPGDEFLVTDPYFVMYKQLIRFLGGKSVFVDTYPKFVLDPAELEAKVTSKTKAIIVNSPANPTGNVLSKAELRALAAFAEAHDLLVISDEIYDDYVYDGELATISQFYPNTIVLNGFSKSVAMTGWRVGYALGPAELIAAMRTLQQYTYVCAPSFAQKAALVALDYDNSHLIAEYKRKRDRIYEGIRGFMEVEKPGGAFFIFPKAPGTAGGMAFVEEAISRNLLIIPGNVFSEEDTHVRISFAASEETIDRGIAILKEITERYG